MIFIFPILFFIFLLLLLLKWLGAGVHPLWLWLTGGASLLFLVLFVMMAIVARKRALKTQEKTESLWQ